MYFVKRKKRYCRMTVKKGKQYCGEHQESSLMIAGGEEDGVRDKRVRCPIDPTQPFPALATSQDCPNT